MPIPTIVPTGSVASAAGISLGGLVLGISQEAQTLSAIVTDSASRSSYVLKIQAIESKWDNYFGLIGGINPPSYDTICTGGGLKGLIKLAGCIRSGLDKVKVGIEGIDTNNPAPELAEIEGVIASVAAMVQEEEKEEKDDEDDDDDDDEQSTQNESRASKTQESSSTPSKPVTSTTISSSAISSSVSSSVSSRSMSSGIMTDPPCDTSVPQALPAGYSIDNGAAEVVLGFVGEILLSVLGGDVSGFTTSTLAGSTLATISNSEGPTSSSADPRAGKNGPEKTRTLPSTMPTAVTSSTPVVIPGQGGLSPCAEYLSNEQGYAPGTENYCFCDGINAPMLVKTIGGTIVSDCSYTTMPTRGWTPTVTAGYTLSTLLSSTPSPVHSILPTLLTPSTSSPAYQCTMMYVPKIFHLEKVGELIDLIIRQC